MDIVDLLFDRRWHGWIGRTKRAGMVLTGMVAGLYLAQVTGAEGINDPGLLGGGTVLGMILPLVFRQRLPGEVLILAALLLALLLNFAI
jgi:hypothetical protein